MYFFLIAPSIPLIAALNPKGNPTFFNIGLATLMKLGNNFRKIDPKAPPDIIIIFICALLNFISDDMLFSKLFLSLVISLCVKNNS